MCYEIKYTLKAEIIWTLKSVMNGFSVQAKMFHDSKIASSFSMARTTNMYVMNNELAS